MKRLQQSSFARGGQTTTHDIRVWNEAIKYVMMAWLISMSCTTAWYVLKKTSDYNFYVTGKYLQAELWTKLNSNPNIPATFSLPDKKEINPSYKQIANNPEVIRVYDSVTADALKGFGYGNLLGLVFGGIMAMVFIHQGNKFNSEEHIRGSMLVSTAGLRKMIRQFNRNERQSELEHSIGRFPGLKSLIMPAFRQLPSYMYTPYNFAGIPFPYLKETTHITAYGAPSTGKTAAIREMIKQIRERGDRAVIFDLSGALVESYYNPDTDVILNPFDARSPAWTLFDECNSREEFEMAGVALIQDKGRNHEDFWVKAARSLFVDVCSKLYSQNRRTNKDLIQELLLISNKQLEQFVKGTISAVLASSDTAKMTNSIRAVLNTNLRALQYLPREGQGFSVKEWTNKARVKGRESGFIFMTANAKQIEALRGLITFWVETSVRTLVTQERRRGENTFYIFDEIAELHAIPSIKLGLQFGRQYGAAFILGVQVYSQIVETYGAEGAQTISGLIRNHLVLSTSDYRTAEACAQIVGSREIRAYEEGVSYGAAQLRDAVTLTPRERREFVVSPEQIMDLPDRHGYLKYAGGFPAAKIVLARPHVKKRSERFIDLPTPVDIISWDTRNWDEDDLTVQSDSRDHTMDEDGDSGQGFDHRDDADQNTNTVRLNGESYSDAAAEQREKRSASRKHTASANGTGVLPKLFDEGANDGGNSTGSSDEGGREQSEAATGKVKGNLQQRLGDAGKGHNNHGLARDDARQMYDRDKSASQARTTQHAGSAIGEVKEAGLNIADRVLTSAVALGASLTNILSGGSLDINTSASKPGEGQKTAELSSEQSNGRQEQSLIDRLKSLGPNQYISRSGEIVTRDPVAEHVARDEAAIGVRPEKSIKSKQDLEIGDE